MNAQQIQVKLENMKGRAFEYAKDIHKVTSYKINTIEGMFVLRTNKNIFKRKFESSDSFFKTWYETKENIAMDKINKAVKMQEDVTLPAINMQDEITIPAVHENGSSLPVAYEKENSLADELIKILKENITKVRTNASYIPQAQAINNNVNSILHVQKLKLDMMKQMKKL